jgi:S1-C subfamily serine protease
MARERRHVRRASALVGLLMCALPVGGAGQEAREAMKDTPLEVLAEEATRAVVLIDVRTGSDSRQGSGFLVDPSGLILTNQHVVRDARSARVRLASGDVYDRVSILAEDDRRDIAILQIAGFDLPTLPLANSDSVRIGAPVVLIGSPLGLENTVSTGIVSGRRQEPEGFQLLQVTAPASQGSSGGAVLSADGRVVGIATSQLRAGQNLNFAVPINYARGMLQHVARATPVELEPTSGPPGEAATRPVRSRELANSGLTFDLAGLGGYVIESTVDYGNGQRKLTRITYRLIETVGGDAPRIERYLESETTRATEPFGTRQTIRRERVRSLVRVEGLEPLSSRGEVSWWTDEGWRKTEHDIRFEEDRSLGIVTDSAGRTLELDRTLPSGILLRDVRDLAFATLAIDSLVGRSVEFTTFDPREGAVTRDRYDVLGMDSVQVAGETRAALRVNLASDLTNETVFFAAERPRIVLRRVGDQDGAVEEVLRTEVFLPMMPKR